jgi:hypothetical protein
VRTCEIRRIDPRESLEAWIRRRNYVPGKPLMPTREAMRVQRALVAVPTPERVVLHLLYTPSRVPAPASLRRMGLKPEECRARHLAGLKMFAALLSHAHD